MDLQGSIQGKAAGGSGGSFALDTSHVDDFSQLNAKLASGGFDQEIKIRARSGHILITKNDEIKLNLKKNKNRLPRILNKVRLIW